MKSSCQWQNGSWDSDLLNVQLQKSPKEGPWEHKQILRFARRFDQVSTHLMRRIFIYGWIWLLSTEHHRSNKVGSGFVFVTTSNYSLSENSAYKLSQWTFPGKSIYISANYRPQSGQVLEELKILSQQRLTHPEPLICSMTLWGGMGEGCFGTTQVPQL